MDERPPVAAVLLDVGGGPIAEQGLTQDVHALLGEVARATGLDIGHGQVEVVRKALCLPAAGNVRLFDGAGALLRTIRRLNLQCAVVSNASVRSGDDCRADFAGLGLADLVDVFVSSIYRGARKPDPGMFMAALTVLDCRADRAAGPSARGSGHRSTSVRRHRKEGGHACNLIEDNAWDRQPNLQPIVARAVAAVRSFEARCSVTYGPIYGDGLQVLIDTCDRAIGLIDWGIVSRGPLLFDVALAAG